MLHTPIFPIRLAHVHSQGIASMVRNNVVSGINLSKSDLHDTHKPKSDRDSVTCTACVYGKATRSVIPRLTLNQTVSKTPDNKDMRVDLFFYITIFYLCYPFRPIMNMNLNRTPR